MTKPDKDLDEIFDNIFLTPPEEAKKVFKASALAWRDKACVAARIDELENFQWNDPHFWVNLRLNQLGAKDD